MLSALVRHAFNINKIPMRQLLCLALSLLASQAPALELDLDSPVEKSRAFGAKEIIDYPSAVPASPFRDEEAEEAFDTEGKRVTSYGFEMRRLGRGSNAYFNRDGWICLNVRSARGFVCYGKDDAYDERIWIFATPYKGRTLGKHTTVKTVASLYEVDCGYEAIRTLRNYRSSDHFGKGVTNSAAPSKEELDWHFARKGSAEEVLVGAVCRGDSLIPEKRVSGEVPLVTNNIIVNNY